MNSVMNITHASHESRYANSSKDRTKRRLNMKRWVPLALGVLLAAFGAGPQRAHASLRFCNATGVRISVAIAYPDGPQGMVGQGWWVIDAGECKDAISGSLDSRYYYFYAMTPDGPSKKTYSGDTPFCLRSIKFKLSETQYGKDSESDCAAAGLEFAKFVRVDTGNSKDHTVKFTGSDDQAAGSAQRPPVALTGPHPAPSPAPVAGTACQRYPNLC
jgi:uncharacterized membrane protein